MPNHCFFSCCIFRVSSLSVPLSLSLSFSLRTESKFVAREGNKAKIVCSFCRLVSCDFFFHLKIDGPSDRVDSVPRQRRYVGCAFACHQRNGSQPNASRAHTRATIKRKNAWNVASVRLTSYISLHQFSVVFLPCLARIFFFHSHSQLSNSSD